MQKKECFLSFDRSFPRQENMGDNVLLRFSERKKRERAREFFQRFSPTLLTKIVGETGLSVKTKKGKIQIFLSNNGNLRKKEKNLLQKFLKTVIDGGMIKVLYKKHPIGGDSKSGYSSHYRWH